MHSLPLYIPHTPMKERKKDMKKESKGITEIHVIQQTNMDPEHSQPPSN